MKFKQNHNILHFVLPNASEMIIHVRQVLLFPVDRDTHEIFYLLLSNVFDAASLFQTNHVVH